MNKLILIFAGLMTTALLLVGTFVTAAAMRGADLSSLPVVGSLFPEPVEASIDADMEEPISSVEEKVQNDRRSPDQVMEAASSPLQAFLLPTPWSAAELEELEETLQARMAQVQERETALEEREHELKEGQRHLKELHAELERVRTGLIEERDDTVAMQDQTEREQAAAEARKVADLQRFANVFAEGKAKESSKMLLEMYSPEEIGIVLSGLTTERARELLMGIRSAEPSVLSKVEKSYRENSSK